MTTRRRTVHVALSVDVDRYSDAKLRREILPGLLMDGRRPTVEELRLACHNARREGLRVFPPCDTTNPDGSCAGHPEGDDA